MKIIKAYPPNFADIAKVFPVKGKPGIIYAWGDRIYNPTGITIPDYLLAHERVHGVRQASGHSIRGWWQAYIESPEFRLAEEILAHRAEYRAYRDSPKTTGVPNYLAMMAMRLSGPLYGNLIHYHDAIKEITHDDAS